MDDLLSDLESILTNVAGGDTLSIATNATGEIQVVSLSDLLAQSSSSTALTPATPTLLEQLGVQSALIIRDANGNILWQSGPIPTFNPAYAVFGIGMIAFVVWLLFRGIR